MSEQDESQQLDCSAVIADVWLMLDGECDETTRARLKWHLDECGACLEAYGIEEKVKNLVNRKCGGETAPESLRQRLSVELRRTILITNTEAES
ncbi:mycothiol system anti-sigma-R factor [Rhodococcus marinonascens]|uniref:mycothiol system anti-sigma-R factor n=1 Tax=Rhodococcus marinonascens TaxID=38311 RepID=UPI000934E704|nr:mycothiol system anti-sigma-R factor [Rhodococcus marinonascens]